MPEIVGTPSVTVEPIRKTAAIPAQIQEGRGYYCFLIAYNSQAGPNNNIRQHVEASSVTGEGIMWPSKQQEAYGVLLTGSKVTEDNIYKARQDLAELGFVITREFQEI